ncbi:MAG: tRNA (N(6)-L-threonylcarbamoyladenosine(37)-C(2))-methylthiotransferase MtaB [Thermodesulfovibrionales bacterium]
MRFSILTLGCKTNQAESEHLLSSLLERGYEEVELKDRPDICIINTCTVTAKTDYQSRQLIRRALRTGAKVIVTGCYAQRAPEEINEISHDCVIVANDKKNIIFNMLSHRTSSNTLYLPHRSRPIIKIQDGCNKKCSYCIIPSVRGRSRSRKPFDIIDEIKRLEDTGFNEVVLTGINLGSYGLDLRPPLKLEDLLKEIISATKKIRIRLSSLGIKEVSSRLIDLIKESGRICRHIHLSLQSGDDIVLKIMNRNYRAEDFIRLVDDLKTKIEDINIGADVIVGFPGEKDSNFENTYRVIEKVAIGYLHIFPYSKRPGTPASEMPEQIDSKVKSHRFELLKNLDRRLRNSFKASQLGKQLQIVVEKIEGSTVQGKTDNYLDVSVSKMGLNITRSDTLLIIIKEIADEGLIGEPLLSL